MSFYLDVSEILQFAIYVEQNGYEFYTEIAKKFDDLKLLNLLHLLAEEEQNHERSFKIMKEKGGEFIPIESYSGEYEAYMKQYLNSFAPKSSQAMKERLANVNSLNSALDMGIGLEKDSIIFYSTLKGLVPQDSQKILDQIIQEEVKHLLKLSHFKITQVPDAPDVDAT